MSILEIASKLVRFVIESGRVEGEGEEYAESLEVEVEFEARERGYGNPDEIAQVARKNWGK